MSLEGLSYQARGGPAGAAGSGIGPQLAQGLAQQDDEDNELELELEDEPDVELSGVVFSHLKR